MLCSVGLGVRGRFNRDRIVDDAAMVSSRMNRGSVGD